MPNSIDLTNQKFSRWTVIRKGKNAIKRPVNWVCKCICGIERSVSSQSLRNGSSKSCGCLNKEVHRKMCIDRNTTHALSKTPTYDTWINLKQRCYNPNAKKYKIYGHLGIRVCKRWQKFENFFIDMGHRPSKKHTIDRINPRGHYEPGNCRWALHKVQQNNRGNNRLITFNGETKTLQQWSEHLKMPRKTLSSRLDRLGWPLERAMTEPGISGKNQYFKKSIP